MKNKYAQVLVNIAKIGTKTFSYLIPDDFQEIIKIGQPVLVPFGNQGTINAFVVGFSNYLQEGIKAKSIYEILDTEPIFDIEYLHFLNWVSEKKFKIPFDMLENADQGFVIAPDKSSSLKIKFYFGENFVFFGYKCFFQKAPIK